MRGIFESQMTNTRQILFSTELQQSVSITVSDVTGTVTENGRKLMKAGTPLTGNLENRSTAFTLATDATVKGVLLHDVDVTNGPFDGTLLIFGFVNLDRLDDATKTKLSATVKTALDGKVTFLSDN